MTNPDLSGAWQSFYEYGDGRYSEHVVTLAVDDTEVIGRSVPQDDDSEVVFDLTLDPDNAVLSGFWREHTSPDGHYQGRVFHGVLQLLITDNELRGTWVGFNSSRTHINTGAWILRRQ